MPLSPEFPYAPRFVEVGDTHLHYVEVGHGRPVVFLPGNPTWSYVWRNVLPWVAPRARCLAVDYAGMGRSGKPAGEYRFADHARYLAGFLDALDLEDVVLVLSDWGGALGLDWARQHESRLRGLALVSAGWLPLELVLEPASSEKLGPAVMAVFETYRGTGAGWRRAVEENHFVEQTLRRAVLRGLGEAEMTYYREPFLDPASRRPIWRWNNEVPIDGEPADMVAPIEAANAWLRRTGVSKLFVHSAGPVPFVDWCREHLSALETAEVGPVGHYLQEDRPDEIGRALARWLRAL